jgi:DNA-binding MarR family transcriptional regulator
MIICVAVTTKSMTTNKATRETLLQKTLQDKIDFLLKKIVSLSDGLKAKNLFSSISSADVVLEFERIELKHSEPSRTRFRILNVFVARKGGLTLTERSKRVSRSKYSTAGVIDKLIKGGPITGEAIGGDRRPKNITVTRKGTAFAEETMSNRLKMTNEATACLTGNRMVSLTGVRKKLKKHLLNIVAAKGPDLRRGVEIC